MSRHSPAESPPRTGTTSPFRQGGGRDPRLTDLREVVDVIIGVDTHVHTHSAAVVETGTGEVLDEITVEATPDGYARLVEFADEHDAVLRAWAIEGTGGHGAGLARHLASREEMVVELDRPGGTDAGTVGHPTRRR